MMDKINLELSIEEANLILDALGRLPFVDVFSLIGKIQQQANEQLNGNNSGSVAINPPKNTE